MWDSVNSTKHNPTPIHFACTQPRPSSVLIKHPQRLSHEAMAGAGWPSSLLAVVISFSCFQLAHAHSLVPVFLLTSVHTRACRKFAASVFYVDWIAEVTPE